MRKLVITALAVVVVVVAILIVVSGVQTQRTAEQRSYAKNPSGQPPIPAPATSSPTTSQSPAQNGSPASQSPSGNKGSGRNHATKPNVDVVYVAVDDMVAVQKAMFMPASQLESTIRKLAAPAVQTRLINAFLGDGPVMARSWGYNNPSDVLLDSKGSFQVDADKVRVNFVDRNNASVSVFAIVHWVTASRKSYYVPSLETVTLQKAAGNWQYVDSQTPPAGEAPQFTQADTNKSFDQIYQLYVPYLKGYATYVPQNH